MRKPEQKDLIQARKSSNMFRFKDDLTAINDGSEFVSPPKLEQKHENSLDL